MSKGCLIIGAGGHAKVIADILHCQGVKVLGFVDDNPNLVGQTILGLPVVGLIGHWANFEPSSVILGIGSNAARRAVAERLETSAELPWITAIHPSAIIAKSVRIGNGTVIMAGAVINPDTVLGQHVIINTASSVDHDCTIGSYVHIAPGTHVAGGVSIGSEAFLGIGTSVIPNRKIGENAIIGAGAVVISDIPPNVTAVGVPAKVLNP